MTDYHNLRNRRARLDQALAQARQVQHQRTTTRLLLVINALASALVVVLSRRYGVF